MIVTATELEHIDGRKRMDGHDIGSQSMQSGEKYGRATGSLLELIEKSNRNIYLADLFAVASSGMLPPSSLC